MSLYYYILYHSMTMTMTLQINLFTNIKYFKAFMNSIDMQQAIEI